MCDSCCVTLAPPPSPAFQTSIEIATVNVVGMLHEVEAGARYSLAKAHDVYSGLGGGAYWVQETCSCL